MVPGLKTALVLGGGAARGAYEAGVVSWLREALPRETGAPLRLDILAGTSVGAVNACYLATRASDHAQQARTLAERWKALKLEDVLRVGPTDLARLALDLVRRTPHQAGRSRRAGMIDPRGLQEIASRHVVWREIGRCIEAGSLEALVVTATHVASGCTTVFVQRHAKAPPPPMCVNPHYRAVSTRIGLKHAMASAAIPVLFPPVSLGGELYVDGGLRQNVPLSPALRLGAQRVVVVTLRHAGEVGQPPPVVEAERALAAHPGAPIEEPRELALPSGPFLFGKALDTLLNDRVEEDLDRLRRTNALLEAGTRAYGPGFARLLNSTLLPMQGQPVRYVRTLVVRPSQDLGRLAAEFARSPEFRRRASGFAGRLVRRLADSEAPDQADLASYLMFDGAFAEILIDLGRRDAAARLGEWLRFCSDDPESEVEAAQLEELRALGG
ncbi:MAG: patatin-like phospholipase family protein [Deltaproteobacteria bacterium]|nr:patatin-like phospholipase family protein [Deltaproteobacteria bacterium]